MLATRSLAGRGPPSCRFRCGGHYRNTHSQSLWEELLGRKLEPAAAKKLEDAFLEYRVRKSVPSWLPFLPNRSFWIPSSEDTIKNLQVLAERIKLTKSTRKSSPANNSSSDDGAISDISKVAEWSLIQQTDKLLCEWGQPSPSTNSAASVVQPLPEKGTVIEIVSLDTDGGGKDEGESDREEDAQAITKKKPESESDREEDAQAITKKKPEGESEREEDAQAITKKKPEGESDREEDAQEITRKKPEGES